MDPISDMIVRIKNATDSKKESVVFPYSKLKLSILDCLQKEGYIKSFGKKGKKVVKFIDVGLSYEGKESRINGVKRVSKSSKRVYLGSKDVRKVKNGLGSLILSTPKGIMTDKMAREAKTGRICK
ncbi:MAG: small subunit ribosomal protein S8 [Parcubacteria group bacterium Gr01-1014_46]|nr:MAG: small subunit ribosomal protein S8 [Parcubacteria group bacterium Gr01-1014_46]